MRHIDCLLKLLELSNSEIKVLYKPRCGSYLLTFLYCIPSYFSPSLIVVIGLIPPSYYLSLSIENFNLSIVHR